MICAEGTIRTGSYQDKKHSDVTHYTTDVYVESVEFTGSKADSQGGVTNQQPTAQKPSNEVTPADFTGSLSDFEEILSDGDVPF